MIEELQEPMFDLLAKKATEGLDGDELAQLEKLMAESEFTDDGMFDIAAAAVGLVDLRIDEPLPAHLHASILASGNDFITSLGGEAVVDVAAVQATDENDYQKVFTIEPPRRSWNWLGWALAAVAVVALGVNIWFTRISPTELAKKDPTPTPTPEKLSVEQEYAKFIAEPAGAIRASWAPGSPKETDLKDVGGDVVWSDEKQKGFMRLKGLPVNDKTKSTYQLWIFDKTQDKATPIDGGTFDVDKNGEVIIPINAKLKALGPELFAITIEKPGGVVVSKRDKIAALAKVETQARSNT